VTVNANFDPQTGTRPYLITSQLPLLSCAVPAVADPHLFVLNAAAAHSSVQAMTIDEWFVTFLYCCTIVMFYVQLRDILQTYNRVTELCFRRCASNFNHRNLTSAEVCIFLITNITCTSGTGVLGQMQIMTIQANFCLVFTSLHCLHLNLSHERSVGLSVHLSNTSVVTKL